MLVQSVKRQPFWRWTKKCWEPVTGTWFCFVSFDTLNMSVLGLEWFSARGAPRLSAQSGKYSPTHSRSRKKPLGRRRSSKTKPNMGHRSSSNKVLKEFISFNLNNKFRFGIEAYQTDSKSQAAPIGAKTARAIAAGRRPPAEMIEKCFMNKILPFSYLFVHPSMGITSLKIVVFFTFSCLFWFVEFIMGKCEVWIKNLPFIINNS